MEKHPVTRRVFFKRLTNQSGAAMIEYGLLVALLALSVITAMNFVRGGMEEEFGELSATLGEGHG